MNSTQTLHHKILNFWVPPSRFKGSASPFLMAPISSLYYLSYYCDKRPDKGTLGRQKEGSFWPIVSHRVQSVVEEKVWWQEREGNSPSSAAQVSTLETPGHWRQGLGNPMP